MPPPGGRSFRNPRCPVEDELIVALGIALATPPSGSPRRVRWLHVVPCFWTETTPQCAAGSQPHRERDSV
jgi:hypothetical protein